MGLRTAVAGLDLPLRVGVWVALTVGVMGCAAGLIIGLIVYAPTAWAAMFEVGIPSVVVGFGIGTAAGGVAQAIHTRRSRPGLMK